MFGLCQMMNSIYDKKNKKNKKEGNNVPSNKYSNLLKK